MPAATCLLCSRAACNMICCYADELKEGFYPYVEQVGVHDDVADGACIVVADHCWSGCQAAATGKERRHTYASVFCLPTCLHPIPEVQVTQIMVPLLKFFFHEEVRSAAAQVNC